MVKSWAFFKKSKSGKSSNSLFWFLNETFIHGARMDISHEAMQGLGVSAGDPVSQEDGESSRPV